MLLEVLAVSLSIDDFVEARLKEEHREKCGHENLHDEQRCFGRVHVWHAAILP
jgi:hypothetical protein